MFQIVFVRFYFFVLETINEARTSRAKFGVLWKFFLVPKKRVAVVTLEGFFSVGIFSFF